MQSQYYQPRTFFAVCIPNFWYLPGRLRPTARTRSSPTRSPPWEFYKFIWIPDRSGPFSFIYFICWLRSKSVRLNAFWTDLNRGNQTGYQQRHWYSARDSHDHDIAIFLSRTTYSLMPGQARFFPILVPLHLFTGFEKIASPSVQTHAYGR